MRNLPTGATEWTGAYEALASRIHAVDRDATRIWLHFFPLALAGALAAADDRDALVRRLRLQGVWSLTSQVDSSHWFLYGHRYWPRVKASILEWAAGADPAEPSGLAGLVLRMAQRVAQAEQVDEGLTIGIVLVGLMTLTQTGITGFRQVAPDEPSVPSPKSPAQLVAARTTDDSQGVFGFLRGSKTRFTVCFDERRSDATFALINHQDLTTAAAGDTRDYAAGPRASREGPIPTDCRSASCGTCWVGILGGADKLADVDPLEARRLRDFGYLSPGEAKPIIRLACMAKASGHVTIVIPPWNGVMGSLTADTGSPASPDPSRHAGNRRHEL